MLPTLLRRSFYLNRILKKCLTYNKWKYVCSLSREIRAFSSEDTNKDKLDLSQFPAENIRNFSIVAHVDHGKSTLADRILELLGVISSKAQNKQVLDRLQVERERGITVKAQTASMVYEHDGTAYLLNLIDTPGHVDFSYEVSRSLAACQGVILLIDANQGVQAQTVANFYLAFEQDMTIIPVLNKIDLKNAQPDVVLTQLKNLFEMEPHEVLKISAKHGTGVEDVLQAVVEKIPSPVSERTDPLKALVFDCWYNQYRGVACNVALLNGILRKGDKIQSAHSNKIYEVTEVGILRPYEVPTDILYAGQVGYLMCNMKESDEAQIGDTFYHDHSPVEARPGFRKAKPMVFAGLFPMDQSEFVSLRKAIEKLTLNDSSVSIHTDSSAALGQGWRLGFLGLLHMDVFQQRLEQEYNTSVIVTTPNVPYKVKLNGARHVKFYGAEEITILNPCELPDPSIISEYYEPMVLGTIIAPDTYIGNVMSLCMDNRGVPKDQGYIDDTRVIFRYILPLNEILVDFHDMLKSVTSGYASFDYEDYGYQQSSLVKVTYHLNGNEVGELTMICHLSRARQVAKAVCAKLKETLPRKLFTISIQAYVGKKVIAREDIRALKKDVLAKCYGGDITRKMKLLRRQSEGKERMRRIGNIDMPKDTFIKILKK